MKKLYKKLCVVTLLILSICTAVSANAKAKYIFYFIGDGMGMGHVNTTQTYVRDVLHGSPLLMTTFPVASQVMTFSANSPITDSAAGGTALSTGFKTKNNMVGMNPDTVPIYSISRDFLNAGFAVGVASSVYGDDATPSAFYAHSAKRGDRYVVARQALGSGISFLGAPVFKGMTDDKGKPTSWISDMQADGYSIAEGYEAYTRLGADATKVLMLAENPQGMQVGYTIDSIPGAMTVQELTQACLDRMQKVRGDNGFFMMVEDGNIDWGAHANDGGTVIKEVLNFQNAIDIAYRFYLEHPEETLIVITADHDTGGMALGRKDNPKSPRLSLADYQKISKDRFSDMWRERLAKGENVTWEEMKAFLNENLGFWGVTDITEEEEAALKKDFNATFISRDGKDEKTLYNDFSSFSVRVYDIFNRKLGIGFTSPSHTANFVPLYALGEGSALFTGCLDNTEVPALILKAAGLK